MHKISFKINEVTNRTTIRISKKLYSYRFILFLDKKSDFDLIQTNRINYVFIYHGTVENAEFYFKAHLTTYYNLNNKLNLGKEE